MRYAEAVRRRIASLSFAAVVVVVGCGSFGAEPAPVADGRADASSLPDADASVPDAPNAADAGKGDAGVVAVGLPGKDPGSVACEAVSCPVAEGCCVVTGSDYCSTFGSCKTLWLRCDEADDCSIGAVCCVENGLSDCRTTCAGNPRICKSNSECDALGTCVAHLCFGRAVGFCDNAPLPTGCQ